MMIFENVNIYPQILHKLIEESEIGELFIGLSYNSDILTLYFSSTLVESQELIATNIVNSHKDNYTSSLEYILDQEKHGQHEDISFGVELLDAWIRKNKYEGMNIFQSLWVFARFEEFQVSYDFGLKKIDIFKLFRTGAIPTLYYCILQITPDDMTENYHWVTQDRIDWIKEKIEQKLGTAVCNYIQSLHSPS